MKKLILFIIAISFIGLNLHAQLVPDDNFRYRINQALGQAPTYEPTIADLNSLTDTLNASFANIQSIEGSQYLINLAGLDFYTNQISDISTLSGLTNLTYLNLFSNQIDELSALTNLTNLVLLDLTGNQISEISALSNLTNLYHLNIGYNQISDISALATLTNLTYLCLNDLQINNISALSNLTNISELHLTQNQIENISPLANLTNLSQLWLNDNQISNISVLSGLTNLTYIHMAHNQISDISALSNLTNLTEMFMQDNQIVDISALSSVIDLELLYLAENNIVDISPLSSLMNITKLYLQNNQIIDISALSGLTNLIWLYLYENQIDDISPLSNLSNLTRLKLQGNMIADIFPLVENTGLGSGDVLYLNSNGNDLTNPLSVEAIDVHIPILQNRGFQTLYFPDEVNLSVPCYPSPDRHETSVLANSILFWRGNTLNPDIIYEVYIGEECSNLVYSGNGTAANDTLYINPPLLESNTEYWWKVRVNTGTEIFWSGLWHFYTGDEYGFDADFIVSNTNVSVNEELQFTDLSIGNPTSWEWDFQNDGLIDSYEQHPEFTYTSPGIYSVSLSVSDGINFNTELKNDYIMIDPIIGVNPTFYYDEVLMSNSPNPFNPSTTIKFSIQNDSKVVLSIYNIKGQKIKTLIDNDFTKGRHSIIWLGDDENKNPISSGIYYYKMNVNGTTEAVRKCLLLK